VFHLALILTLAPLAWQTNSALSGVESTNTAVCTQASVSQLVQAFVDNFNRGDIQPLDKLVAEPGQFAWYSTDSPGQRINDEAYNRSSLMAYFTNRHNHHERLKLQEFRFTGISGTGRGNFEFKLTRSSDDGLSSAGYGGKGAADCSRVPNTLVAWSMARESFLSSNVPTYVLLGALLLVVVAASVATRYWRRRRTDLPVKDGQSSSRSSSR
jgi:hypothetical protein